MARRAGAPAELDLDAAGGPSIPVAQVPSGEVTMADASATNPAPRPPVRVDAEGLRRLIGRLFSAAGLSERAAKMMADALVEADLEGLSSHGVMQAEVYLERLKRG